MKSHSQIILLVLILLVAMRWPVYGFSQTSIYQPLLSVQEKAQLEKGEIVLRDISAPGSTGQTVEVIGLMHSPAEQFMELLTDYESYPDYMSAVGSVSIVTQTADASTLNYVLNPILGFTKKYRIQIAPAILAEGVWKIQWQMVPWPGLKEMETIGDTQGHWLIIRQGENLCLVQYHVYSDPGPVPFGLGGIVDALGQDSIEKLFLETRDQAEKTAKISKP